MGEMADYALDIAFEQLEHFSRFENSSLQERYEEGIIDEWNPPVNG